MRRQETKKKEKEKENDKMDPRPQVTKKKVIANEIIFLFQSHNGEIRQEKKPTAP